MRTFVKFALAALLFSPTEAAAGLGWVSDSEGLRSRDAHGNVIGVDLRASWIDDADLASLAAIPTLTKVDLSETRITDHGLRKLKDAPAVSDLTLRYAELIGDEGLSAFKTWKHLKRLDLTGTKVTDSGLQHIANLTSLQTLDLGSVLVTDAGVGALTSLSNLKELTLGGNKLTDAGLQVLRQLPSLTSLDLGGAQRTDSGIWSVSLSQPGLTAIAMLKNLERLRLNQTAVSGAHLKILTSLPRLAFLDLHDCPNVNDEAIPLFVAMPALRTLDVTGTKITGEGVEKLRRAKPQWRIFATTTLASR